MAEIELKICETAHYILTAYLFAIKLVNLVKTSKLLLEVCVYSKILILRFPKTEVLMKVIFDQEKCSASKLCLPYFIGEMRYWEEDGSISPER
jgi:hypothetical protein